MAYGTLVRRRLLCTAVPPPSGGKLFVVGGNGFVGSAVCKAAVQQGMEVTSLSRSGRPSRQEEWMDSVQWHVGDVFDRSTWVDQFQSGGYTACVGAIGAFGNNDFMEKMNGDANIVAVEESAKSDSVTKFVFVSGQ